MENIHQILYAIVNLHIRSETAGSVHLATLDHIGKFAEYIWSRVWEGDMTNRTFPRTLHKIHTFIKAQQEGSKIKYFFRHGEMNTLLKDCHSGLDQALQVFKACVKLEMEHNTCANVISIKIGTIVFNSIDEMKKQTQNMHNELLELISSLSDGTSDRSTSVCTPCIPQHLIILGLGI
jgi:hypothetical protein